MKYSKSDVYLCRGVEYQIMSDRYTFDKDEIVRVKHSRIPLSIGEPHYFKTKIKSLVETSLCCPICDSYSSRNAKVLIKKKLNTIKGIKIFESQKIDNKIFDFRVVYKGNDIYIKYFSTMYYTNVLNERPIVKKYRNFCKKNNINYLEINHINIKRVLNDMNKEITRKAE